MTSWREGQRVSARSRTHGFSIHTELSWSPGFISSLTHGLNEDISVHMRRLFKLPDCSWHNSWHNAWHNISGVFVYVLLSCQNPCHTIYTHPSVLDTDATFLVALMSIIWVWSEHTAPWRLFWLFCEDSNSYTLTTIKWIQVLWSMSTITAATTPPSNLQTTSTPTEREATLINKQLQPRNIELLECNQQTRTTSH